ncbi:58 kDa protein, partial [Cactus mild mottle virus]
QLTTQPITRGVNMYIPTAKCGDPSDLQFFYDAVLPNNSTVLNDFDSFTLTALPMQLHVGDCTLDLSKADPNLYARKTGFLKPVLRTGTELPRQPNLWENLLALIKRNFNAPYLMGTVDIDRMAESVVNRFFEVYIDGSIESCKFRLLAQNTFAEWLKLQNPDVIGKLANFDYIDLPAIDQYYHMIKRKPKIKLDQSICTEYPALQTIVYHSKEINAIFGPIFKELTRVFLDSVDSSRFLFYTRKSADDVSEFFSDLPHVSQTDVYELDISKYDKSQNELHCAIEYKIWERLGFDGFLRDVWAQGHRRTVLRDFQAGIKALIWFQRKSGDVTTFIGNTFINAAAIATLMPLEHCIKAGFCGDDSVIYLPKGTPVGDVQAKANLEWNFEAKLYKKTYGYFCGRFIIPHSTGAIVYPDVLKVIAKLGAKDVKDFDHLEELRVSMCDTYKQLGNCAYVDLLYSAMTEVYPSVVDPRFAINTVWKYLTDKRLFKSCHGFCRRGPCEALESE